MRQVISLLMENESGALSRVVGLFSQRGYNIETLNVAPTEDNSMSRLTLSTSGDAKTIAQICSHLERLLDVVFVKNLSGEHFVEKELVLIKLKKGDSEAHERLQKALTQFSAEIIEETEDILIVQLCANTEELSAFLYAIDEEQMLEIVRSGVCGIDLHNQQSSDKSHSGSNKLDHSAESAE